MTQNANDKSLGPDLSGIKKDKEQAITPPAQPANPAKVPEGVNPGGTALAASVTPTAPYPGIQNTLAQYDDKQITPVPYTPGGLNPEIIRPAENKSQSDQNFPFSAGHKMHEVAQTQNYFSYPLDTYYNVFDAIYYFSDQNNRNRYTYEQQQIIISRIVRAAQDFGIPIEGIRDKLKN